MKKLLGSISTGLFFLSTAVPAFAQVDLDPCAKGSPGSKINDTLCSVDATKTGDVISNIIIALFVIAAVLALVFLVWGGIKWILSGGDKTKVEAARSTIIAAIIGLIIVFLSYFILQIVLGLFGINITDLQIPNLMESS